MAGYRNLTNKTPKYAVIDAASSGTRTIVAAVSGKKICVLSYYGHAAGNTTVVVKSFDGSSTYTDLSGTMQIENDSSGLSADWNPDGHYETLPGEALVWTIGGNNVGGHLTYIEV